MGFDLEPIHPMAGMSVKKNTDWFAHYFHRKPKEGKPKMLVLNNIANKLIHIFFSMIKTKQPHIENYQFLHPRLRQAETRS